MPECSCPCRMSGEKPDTVQITDNVLKVLKVDDAVNTTFVCEVKNRIGIGREKVTVIVRGEFEDTNKHSHRHVIMKVNKCIACA